MQPAMYETALRHYQAGRLAEASALCGTILNRTPRNFQALCLLGAVRGREGAFEEAVYFLTAALGIGSPNPTDALMALNELATVELAQQHFDVAIDCYHRALTIRPGDARTLYNYGNALFGAGQFDAAIAVYRQGVAADPDYAEIHSNLGTALRAAGKLEEATDCYRRAIELRPSFTDAHNNLGRTLCLLDRAEEAVQCHRQAIALSPNDADSLIDLGNALTMTEQLDEACEHYRHALRLRPDAPTAVSGLGIALSMSYRHDEAVVWLERAVAISPSGPARMALGNALIYLNRHAEALSQFREARALLPDSPELTQNEGFALLATGAWKEGWERLEARFAVPRKLPLPTIPDELPLWRGDTSLDGKTILLQSEQGLGDTLQFVRYVPLVKERGGRVVLQVQPRLGKLLADMPGADMVITSYESPGVDLVCPLMSLPLAFGTTLASVPANVPYLRTPPDYLLLWQALLGARVRPRIGVAWSGSQHMPYRSMPIKTLAPLLRRPEFEFHALQLEIPEADREWLAENPLLIDHSEEQKDFVDTAALIAAMDLVVTIDTSVAHMAGAIARPVWIMLPFSADPRWMVDREDTPWYPTARLFRQKIAHDWDKVVKDVLKALG